MSKPEIARRCHTCGASVREQAAFCPQCGKELVQREESSAIHDTEDIAPAAEPAPQEAEDADEEIAEAELHDKADIPIKNGLTLTEADFQAQRDKPAPAPEPALPTPASGSRAKTPHVQAALGEVGAKIQRATHRARDVQDNAMHRVQKVREISSVMIEEASYDPSLRFVLVAGVLFLLFLIIALLNKLIG
jgi:predicted RNA-binding Zn-ribbon protein involved in translation (DUF1610 family)